MSDEDRRKKERTAKANGDATALDEAQLLRMRERMGQGRHARLIGKVVTMDGVRTSYHGTLEAVEEVGGGVAILYMGDDCVALEALDSMDGSVPTGAFEVYSHGILGIGRAKF
jgi:hypothetical protein